MKKLGIVFMIIITIIMLSSCSLFSVDVQNENPIFDNTSVQTAQEIKEKINFYKTKLLTLIDQPLSNRTNKKLSIGVGPGREQYSREELPLEYDYPYDPDEVDSEFIMTKTMLLSEYEEAIDVCSEFKEDSFCTAELDDYNVYLKVLSEDDKLYIEAYRYQSLPENNNYYSVGVDIIYLNYVNENVYLEYVRDYYEQSDRLELHDRYYDAFCESGEMLNVHVNMKKDDEVYYQYYVKSSQNVFLFSNSEEGLGFNYTDTENEKFYSITFDATGELEQNFMSYGIHNPTLRYSQGSYIPENNIRLTWNLLDVDGWNQVVVDENGYDEVYLDEVELLTDFMTDISIQDYTTAMTSISISEEELTQDVLNLSNYGLLYDTVSYNQFMIDRTYLANHYIDILESHYFDEDMSENRVKLLGMFPFVGDDEIVSDLFTQMKG